MMLRRGRHALRDYGLLTGGRVLDAVAQAWAGSWSGVGSAPVRDRLREMMLLMVTDPSRAVRDHLHDGDVVIVTRLDRLAHSVAHLLELVRDIEAAGPSLRC
jgi:hypothetical protein